MILSIWHIIRFVLGLVFFVIGMVIGFIPGGGVINNGGRVLFSLVGSGVEFLLVKVFRLKKKSIIKSSLGSVSGSIRGSISSPIKRVKGYRSLGNVSGVEGSSVKDGSIESVISQSGGDSSLTTLGKVLLVIVDVIGVIVIVLLVRDDMALRLKVSSLNEAIRVSEASISFLRDDYDSKIVERDKVISRLRDEYVQALERSKLIGEGKGRIKGLIHDRGNGKNSSKKLDSSTIGDGVSNDIKCLEVDVPSDIISILQGVTKAK